MSFTIGTLFDRAINWDKRLAHEIPFIHAWLRSWNAVEVTDAACGSGRHAHALAAKGFNLIGTDTSDELLAVARQDDPTGTCAFIHRDMAREAGPDVQDALLCLGNSLSLLVSREALHAALERFKRTLRPGGGLIVHVLNYRRFRNPDRCFFPLKSDLDADGIARSHFLKSIFVSGEKAHVHLIHMSPNENGTWIRQVRHDSLLALDVTELQSALLDAGFCEIQVYGGFDGSHYDGKESHDLVLCAKSGP